MKKLLGILSVLVSLLSYAPGSWGQAQITTGTVQGNVADERGGAVSGASVEARNLDTNFVRTETTDADGHFAFLSLAPGRYELKVSQQGFATLIQQNVNLTVGSVITIPVTMKVSSVTQQIVAAAIEYGGTYYLTYQLYPTPEQMHGAYPRAGFAFERKRFYDPNETFTSQLYAKYGRAHGH